MATIHDEIKRGMALAFFASAYADQADECGQPLSGEIMEQLPAEIDPAALHAADTLAADACRVNGISGPDISNCVWALWEHAQSFWLDSTGGDRELTPELFGHYLAMQAMGHGVGLDSFGGAVYQAIRVPYVEFSSHSLQKDYFQPVEGE